MENEYPIPKSRPMGTTESNWCGAVDGGTGTCITGILLGQPIEIPTLQAALSQILSSQPLLRAQIKDEQGQLCFEADDNTLLDIEIRRPKAEDFVVRAQEPWLQIVEDEMNEGFPKEKPFRVFRVRLYELPDENNLIVLRLHSAGADHASAVHVSSELLKHLKDCVEGLGQKKVVNGSVELEAVVPPLEAATPPAKAKKSFWAHGIDVLGYGLGAFRHAILPLENVVEKRESRVIVAAFSEAATSKMVELCKRKSSDLNGLLNAASLKAVAKFKGTGNKGENYASIILFNCRSMLEPVISESTAGFYHSAIMRTVHASETVPLWELATRVTKDFEQSVKNNKHFTDMGDLNMLMVQAMGRPAVTPSSSMRTALISNAYNACSEVIDKELASSLSLRDWITCSSVNGVGPCVAMYPVLRNGCLRVAFVYCNPLFSAETMNKLVGDISYTLNNLDK